MSDNFFVQHPEVTRYILKHEQEARMQEPIIVHEVSVEHTNEQPFCDDPNCPCHGCSTWEDVYRQNEYLEDPFDDGLLTVSEKDRLFWGRQV